MEKVLSEVIEKDSTNNAVLISVGLPGSWKSPVAADIAFLAMDLDYRDREDLADDLLRAYVIRSGDEGVMALLNFYKSYRAYVRGKVESFQRDDPNIPEEKKREAGLRAGRHFDLLHRYALRF